MYTHNVIVAAGQQSKPDKHLNGLTSDKASLRLKADGLNAMPDVAFSVTITRAAWRRRSFANSSAIRGSLCAMTTVVDGSWSIASCTDKLLMTPHSFGDCL